MSLGPILFGALFVVLCVIGLVVDAYFLSGDWLWNRSDKEDRRNWPPPR